MAIKWLDAKRLQGTNAERTALTTGGVSTTTAYGDDSGEGNTSTGNGMGMQYTTDALPVDNYITSCTFNCMTTNTGTSNLLYATIDDSDGDLQATSTNGINNNTINASGTTFSELTFTFDGTYKLLTGDIIALINTNSSGNLRPAQECSLSGANPAMIEYDGSTEEWGSPNTACQFKQSVTWKTPSVYPSLPNGTIFNETDTYKYFMFDGTDTWNQMVSS